MRKQGEAMAKQDRYLQFSIIELDRPVHCWCSACGRQFSASPQPGDRTDDVILRLRAEFDAHDCKG